MKKLSIYVLTIAIAAVLFASCTTDDEPIMPIACMQVDYHNIPTFQAVHLTICSTDADQLLWDMGDGGNTFTYSNIYHAYSDTGTYVVTLVATSGNLSDTITDTIHVHN